ncbi:MAG: hypothetical protein P4L53_08370 [Candidatus Obscuribacterales bacterium]|nr:hypothetical protein [Candidatus Obscuribacterales bacterium]
MASEKLNWIDFLNESCTWETKALAEQFLSGIAGSTIKLTPVETSHMSDLESYMREQLASIHFRRKLDLEYINERLSKLQLELTDSKSKRRRGRLPSLSPSSSIENNPLQRILDSVLFQFACFLGETIDSETPYTVARCEAIYKTTSLKDCKSFYKKFRSLENSWKEEILDDSPMAPDLERCADFFISAPGTKFCTDICRFNSFAVRKQIEIPSYQAEKQRRYRERQKSKS